LVVTGISASALTRLPAPDAPSATALKAPPVDIEVPAWRFTVPPLSATAPWPREAAVPLMATPVALMVPPIAANPAPTPVKVIEAPFAIVTVLATPFASTAWPPPVVMPRLSLGTRMAPPAACNALPFWVCTVISPGSGPAAASHTNVPPVTLLALVAPATETAVLPTTVVVPAVTLIVVVTVGGLGPIVCVLAGFGIAVATLMTPPSSRVFKIVE
jgi:hypothetical protein